MATEEAIGVTVRGEETVRVADTPAVRDRFEWETASFTINCHTGRILEGRWSGFRLWPLLEAARIDPETTHLLVTARDGYRACVELLDGHDALLGFVREAFRVRNGEEHGDGTGTPRFLTRGIDSSRTVREVASVEGLVLSSDEDPHDYEIE
ncbi:MAG: hypothetical protein V5A23_06600 [Halobacteriales archaeon]